MSGVRGPFIILMYLTANNRVIIRSMPTSAHAGPIWNIGLSHPEVLRLLAAGAIAPFALPIPPPVAVVIDTSIAYIVLMDGIGGFHGVDITVVEGAAGCVVSPQGSGIYPALSQAVNVAVDAGRTIGDFIVKTVLQGVQSVSGTVAISAGALIAGVPGAVIGGLLHGLFGGGGQPAPPPRGGVAADSQGQPTGVNKFVLCQISPGNGVSLLSWQGFFCPQNGGGTSIYANTNAVGQFERLVLEDNGDGTVSLRCDATGTSFYLRAEYGGGNVCQWDTTNPGVGGYPHRTPQETSFRIVPLEAGNIALQTYSRQYYVRVSQ